MKMDDREAREERPSKQQIRIDKQLGFCFGKRDLGRGNYILHDKLLRHPHHYTDTSQCLSDKNVGRKTKWRVEFNSNIKNVNGCTNGIQWS